jgi:hypothetical protein
LATAEHIKSADFDRYLAAINDGLSEEQAHLIHELLGRGLPPVADESFLEETE